MGRYTTRSLVEAELEQIKFTTTSKVRKKDADEFIAQEENTLDAAVSSKYTTPVSSASSPISFSIMKTIATYMVAYRVLKIIDPQKADGAVLTEGKNTIVSKVSLKQLAESMIVKIKSGMLFLTDAVQVSDQVASFQNKNTTEGNQFSMEGDQW